MIIPLASLTTCGLASAYEGHSALINGWIHKVTLNP
jgi:hypothetical protein